MQPAHNKKSLSQQEPSRKMISIWLLHDVDHVWPSVCLFFKWWFLVQLGFSIHQHQHVYIGSVCACQPGSGLLSWDPTHPGWSLLEFSLNHHHFSSCDINLASATQWSFLMHSNCRAHSTRSQFEICMKNGGVSWWKSFAIKRQANEIEILGPALDQKAPMRGHETQMGK